MNGAPSPEVTMFSDFDALCRFAAELILARAEYCVQKRNIFTLVLSGGSTPASLYELLGAGEMAAAMPWKNIHIFWSDERVVPRESEHSNFRMAWERFLTVVGIPPANIHPFHVDEGSVEENARLSVQDIKNFFCDPDSALPSFDLVLLGMGPDGHTASLFPGSMSLAEDTKIVVAVPAPGISPAVPRLTLTLPVLNNAETVVFLVSGKNKHNALKQVLKPRRGLPLLPAGRVQPTGRIIWLVHPPFE